METTPWDPEGATAVLDREGRLSDAASLGTLDLKSFYKLLVAARCLDLRLARMNLPMWASSAGEEAPLVATGMVASAQDWIFPGIRDAAVALTRGLPYEELAAQLVGRAGSSTSVPGRVADPSRGVAASTDALGMHLALATGSAHGQKLQGRGAITFALFGEGVTTTGAFHEAMMLSAACDLPMVFVCRSQTWPNGAPAEAGLVGDSVSDRARTHGVWTRRVDGADPVAVHTAITTAATRARDGRGPGLVEVVVTQLSRDPPAHRDPVERLRRHLDGTGIWTQTFQDVIEAEVRGKLDRALSAAAGNGVSGDTP
jgi:TPP-dependent pyruvate/acetoin dehydrogenase alpha subunit